MSFGGPGQKLWPNYCNFKNAKKYDLKNKFDLNLRVEDLKLNELINIFRKHGTFCHDKTSVLKELRKYADVLSYKNGNVVYEEIVFAVLPGLVSD